MPPLPALHIAALADLAKQLRFIPAPAARRQLERAEDLFAVLQSDQEYPEDWIVFAITGYRPDLKSPPLVRGDALRGELGILAERLSAAAQLTEPDLPGLTDATPRWLDADALCARWNISRKTLDRYRRRGLPARRVRSAPRNGKSGRDRLFFALRFITDFESRHAETLRGAGAFSRLDAALETKLLRLAERLRRRFGWSLNRTAEQLASRFGRGHETVRQLLRRHLRSDSPGAPAKSSAFTERGPLQDRERRAIARAYARGIDTEAIATHFTRTRASVYRVLARQRADFLRSLPLVGPDTPDLVGAGARGAARTAEPLRAASALTGLGRPAPASLADMLAEADADPLTDPRAERERATAYWLLRVEAARLVGLLPRHNPTAGACDQIETRLRWASRLKAELVRSQQGLIFKTIRAGLGHDITSLSRSAAASLLTVCLDAAIEGTDQFDPGKGGRLAAPVGLAVNRAVTRWGKSGTPERAPTTKKSRAVTFVEPAALPLDDWTRRLDPWQPNLEPDRRVRLALSDLDPLHARFLAARFGWSTAPSAPVGPPQTIAELAASDAFHLTLHHASALEHTVLAAALRAARALAPKDARA